MALNNRFTRSDDGERIIVNSQESELQKSYNDHVANNPDFEYHVSEQPVQQSQPQTNTPKAPQQTPTEQPTQMVSAEQPYDYNAHFSQQWFLDELENRKNPEYAKQGTDIMDDSTFEAIANAVKIRKDATPDQWKYGDPGWKTDTDLYQEYIKPMETKYRQTIHNAQIAEMEKSSYDAHMENTKYNPSADAGVDNSAGNFSNLPLSGKVVYHAMPGVAGTDINNVPETAKWTQPALTAIASSGGVANIAKDIAIAAGVPIVGPIHYGVKTATFAYNYTKQLGLHQGIPLVDKMLEMVDLPDEKMQQALGAFNRGFEKAGGGDLSDSSKIVENIDFIANNLETIFDYAFGSNKASTEYDSDIVGMVTSATANMGATPIIGDLIDRSILNAGAKVFDDWIAGGEANKIEHGQTTRYNLGQSGVYDIPEEMTGSNAVQYWLDTVQGWRDEGVTDINDLQFLFWTELNKVYGDKANISEFTEHELLDPSNTMENMETRAVNLYAKATGDKNLEIASQANIGTWAGDLTDNIPVIPGIIRGIGKLVGDNDILRTSNGINEVLAAWNQENISNPTSELTARDRRISRIDKNGVIKDMTPNKGKVLADTKVGEYIARAVNLTQKTNETKAAYEGDAIFDYINVMVEDAVRARGNEDINTTVDRLVEFVDELEHPEMISSESPFYKSSQSALFNSIKDDVAEAVRTSKQNIIDDINRFRNLENNRNVLYTVSSALNMTPTQFMEKYNNEKLDLTQMIANKADENGGTIPGITVPVESQDFGEQVMQMIRPFAGDDGQAYDVRQLGLQVTSNLADGVSNTLVRKYNIQPEGLVYRFGDMIKKMQSLVLLGLSPSYLANNFVNNVATRTALGYGGFLSGKTMNDWMSRFGYTPERMQESFTQDYLGDVNEKTSGEKLNKKIRDAKQNVDGKGMKKGLAEFMSKTGDFASNVNKKVGIFSKLSGEIEQQESKQVSVSAMMTYMSRTWKAGINFRKMPVELEAAINAQCPGMVDAIYSAISGGINMAEIENAIFGSFVLPSVKDSLIQAAQNKGLDRPNDVVTEYFVKNGMLDQLNEALKGKRGDEIDRIVNEFAENLKKNLSVQLSGDLAARAEAIQNMVGSEKFVAAINLGIDMADSMSDLWTYNMDQNSNIFQRRLEEGMAPSKFHELYRKQQQDLNERWKNVYATSQQVYSGVVKGLGMNDKASRQYIDNMKSQQEVWVKFYGETQPELFQPYLDALEFRLDDTIGHRENGKWVPGTWDARVKKAWKTYLSKMKTAYKTALNSEKNFQTAMDNAYLAGLKNALGETKAAEVDSVIAPLFTEMRNKRQEIIEQNRAIRDIADKTSELNAKNIAWQEGNAKRIQLQNEYLQLQHEIYANILAMAPFTTTPAADTSFDAEDHAINIRTDIAEHEADAQQKIAQKYAEKMTDAVLEEKSDAVSSSTPEGWAEDLRRNNLRDIALKTGATTEQAEAYARLVGAYAKAWENSHPGRDYFKDAYGVHLEFIDEDRTVPVIGADGKMYQVETVNRADINTPEFEAWHGNHPENFKDGKPLTTWVGQHSWHPFFDKAFLGANTGAPSAKLGIFSAGKRETAEAYQGFSEIEQLREYSKEAQKTIATAIIGNPDEIWSKYRNRLQFNSELPKGSRRISSPENAIQSIDERWRKIHDNFYSHFATEGGELVLDTIKELKRIGNDAVTQFDNPVKMALEEANKQEREFKNIGLPLSSHEKRELINKLIDDYETNSVARYYAVLDAFDFAEFNMEQAIENENEVAKLLLEIDKQADRDYYNTIAQNSYDQNDPSLSREVLKETARIARESGESPTLREFYLSFNNPYIVDYEGKNRADVIRYSQAIQYAIDNGYDAVILKNTYDGGPLDNIYVVFDENQMKSVYNDGSFTEGKNYYHQEQEQRIKGEFKIEDGQKIVNLFRGSDFSTLIHETCGHGFVTTLNDSQVEALAQYNGWTAEKYRHLENQYYYDPDSMTDEDRQAWIDSQEKFAYGFEQYLREGVAPTPAMATVFEAFKQFLLEIYQGVKNLVYKGEEIDIHKEQNGVTLAQIFDSMLADYNPQGSQVAEGQVDPLIAVQRKAQSQTEFQNGRFVPLEDMDLSTLQPSGSRDAEVDRLAKLLFEREMADPEYNGDHHTLLQYKQYILDSKNEDGSSALSAKDYQNISTYIALNSPDYSGIIDELEALRVGRKYRGNPPQHGDYVAPTYSFDHGGETIVGIVTHDRKVVAYVPENMPLTEVDYDNNGTKVQILGYSPTDPEMLVYKIGNEVRTEPRRENDGSNPYQGEMNFNSTPELDPVPQAHNQMAYEQILPVLQEFARVYRQNLDNNMTEQHYSNLDENTRSLLRGYIDTDVRTDLVNTKYKAGKFGNMMRDAALLNYNNRYGWDNALTFLSPYQFWQTRSFQKWLSRMGSKGGKMWRRYAKLKELERRNKKEFMPSRISGLIGLYLPFLPDWMGDAIFMSTDQLLVVPQFIDPILDYMEGKNAVRAVAERYLREALQDEKITYEQYKQAMDASTRENSPIWQEYLAKAQLTEGADKNLGDMFGQYLGLNLPLSVYNAIRKNDNSEWNQWPITRTGTAWRAMFGDNIVGRLGQDILSAPEKALRSAVSKKYGSDFEYNEFGAFGDYYITQQVWDMVAEGRIDPTDAIEAVTAKDGNKVWEEAADRQREELLVKMQGGLPVDAVKRLVTREGDAKDNWLMLLAGLVTAPMSKQVVREGETTWRQQKEEQSQAFDKYYSGDKDALDRFDEKNPNYKYNSIRYENDPEQALRKYLYQTIQNKWYDLDKEEQSVLQMSFNDNFYDDVLNKDTRVIESMDINRLAAYAQALNGKIPNLATDKINMHNIEPINIMQFPPTTHDEVMTYYSERDRLYPGMNKVSSLYYSLPVEDRKAFRQAMPQLSQYWDWNKQYKKDHPDVANFTGVQSDYYNAIDAENVIDNLDSLTLQYLKSAAYSGKALEPEFKPLVESAMKKARLTDSYDKYIKELTKYILGK